MRTEILLILAVMLAIVVLTVVRYRRQIGAVYRFWQMLKQARIQGNRRPNEMNEPSEAERGPLVNCAKCGTWVPESKAIKLAPRVFYCSSGCVEKAAKPA